MWHHSHALADHHVRSVETHWIDPPTVKLVSRPHPHTALCSLGAVWARRSTPHVEAPPIFGACLCPGCIRQRPEIQPDAFHHPDGLCQSAAPAILDGECPNGMPGWARGPVVRQQRRLEGIRRPRRSARRIWLASLSRRKRKGKEGIAPY